MGAPGVWGFLDIVYQVVVFCLSFGMGWDGTYLLFVAEDGLIGVGVIWMVGRYLYV